MLVKIITHLLKVNIKNEYYSKFIIFIEVLSINITLIIYWFTSKAFSSSVDQHLNQWGSSYFNYLVIGEIFLIIPTYMIQEFSSQIKISMRTEVFNTLMFLPINKAKSILVLGLSSISSTMLQVLLMATFSYCLYDLVIPFSVLLKCLLLQLYALPTFLGMGLIGTSVLVRFGRGQGFINYVCLTGSFLGGAYFPLDVLPKIVQQWGIYVSPFSTLMIHTRLIISDTITSDQWIRCLIILSVMGGFFFLTSMISLKRSLNTWRLRKSRIVFPD